MIEGKRAERTRRALLQAARRVFAEKGYPGTAVADIVAAAGRAHGTFYLYFENKRDIFAALLDDAIRSLEAQSRALWRHETPTRSVWTTVHRFLTEFQANRDLWLLLDQMAVTDAAFDELRERWRQTFVAKISSGIEVSRTELTDGLDTRVLAEILAAMVDEICRVAYLEGGDWDADTLTLHITTLWARSLGYPERDLADIAAEAASRDGRAAGQRERGPGQVMAS